MCPVRTSGALEGLCLVVGCLSVAFISISGDWAAVLSGCGGRGSTQAQQAHSEHKQDLNKHYSEFVWFKVQYHMTDCLGGQIINL